MGKWNVVSFMAARFAKLEIKSVSTKSVSFT